MSYLALPLKYRPQLLSDVTGQDHVTSSLIYAIEHDRIRQAYLFAGIRGTGKTTTARVLAAALNCLSAPEPTATPCLTCRSCVATTQGLDVSVIEIDGASNNGVGDIRELKKKVTTYGMHGRFKIYIIDEAQMLTKPAFNALLKTLEEPPSHVKFILCTTELDKIPKTIRSRCQLFTFYPIADDVMAKQLENVMALESVKFEADLPIELAKMANGSLRDSLTLLDQVINTGESPLTTTTLERFFGKPKKSRVQAILVALGQGDVGKVGRETAQLNRKGFNEYFVVATLIDAMHEIIPTRLNDPEKLETIVDIIIELEALSRSVRTSESPAALLKATLLKIALRRRK